MKDGEEEEEEEGWRKKGDGLRLLRRSHVSFPSFRNDVRYNYAVVN